MILVGPIRKCVSEFLVLLVRRNYRQLTVQLDTTRGYKTRNSDIPPTDDEKSGVKQRNGRRLTGHGGPVEEDQSYSFVSQDLLDVERMSFLGRDKKSNEMKTLPKNVIVEGEIVFGVSSIDLALSAQRRTFHRLFVKKLKTGRDNSRMRDIEERAQQINIPVQKVDVRILDRLAQDRPHQGLCLDASALPFESEVALRRDSEEDFMNVNRNQLWVLLDRIQDPMNMGAVIRSSYYFGVDKIIAVMKRTCRLTPVVSKASSGTAEILKIYQIENTVTFLKSKIQDGWSIIGAASPDAVKSLPRSHYRVANLISFTWPTKSVLLIGNEGDGVSPELLHLCTDIVTIPLKIPSNQSVQSLNVSVATGILLYSRFSQISEQ